MLSLKAPEDVVQGITKLRMSGALAFIVSMPHVGYDCMEVECYSHQGKLRTYTQMIK